MRNTHNPRLRLIAVDPTSRGFGFVVLEGEDRLLDWGLKSIRRNKEEQTLLAVSRLVELYKPDLLVIEDTAHPRSRRVERVRRLLRNLVAVAASVGVETHVVPIAQVRAAFGEHGRTKHARNGLLVARFPELGRHRPKFRKPWMSEDERQAMFDAAAFGWASFASRPTALDAPACGYKCLI